MRTLLFTCIFAVASSGAQMQMPPGTTSPIPATQQAAPTAQSEALQQAEDAITAGRYADAVKLLTPLAIKDQKQPRIFYDLGFAEDAMGDDAPAAAAYREAIARDPNNAAARVSLGLLLARGTDRTGAEEQLAAAVKIPGADAALVASANRALARIHQPTKPEQAREELLAALKVSQETPDDAVLAAEIANALQDDAAAEHAYAHALQLSPGDVDVSLEYARLLAREKNFTEADAVLTRARATHPSDTALLAEQASQQLLQGHAAEALPLLQQLQVSDPKNAAIGLLLARAYSASGSPAKADELYRSLLAASPDDPVLLTEAADSLIRQKRSPEAEPLLQRALLQPERFPSKQAEAQAAGELAFAASASQHAAIVLQALAIREKILPSEPPYSFLKAAAYDTLHQSKEAVEQYQLFLKQSGGKFPDQEWQAQQRLQILIRSR